MVVVINRRGPAVFESFNQITVPLRITQSSHHVPCTRVLPSFTSPFRSRRSIIAYTV
jgi:hypothetical protein